MVGLKVDGLLKSKFAEALSGARKVSSGYSSLATLCLLLSITKPEQVHPQRNVTVPERVLAEAPQLRRRKLGCWLLRLRLGPEHLKFRNGWVVLVLQLF